MNYRLAKRNDTENLAFIHLECGKKQEGGFMHRLGFYFLKAYYKSFLEENKSIIIVAEDTFGRLQGFVSGTLNAEEHIQAIRKRQIVLALSLMPALLSSPLKAPFLLSSIKHRYDFIKKEFKSIQYAVNRGPRMEYWAWRNDSKDNKSVVLLKLWLTIIFDLGVNYVRGEVDINNKGLLTIYKIMGATVVKALNLNDERKRFMIEFINKNKLNDAPDEDASLLRIRKMSEEDLHDVVRIHINSFQKFFLTYLGKGFLYSLYKGFIRDTNSICVIAEKDKSIVGFAIGNRKPNSLFRKLLLHQGFIFIFHSIKALVRSPILVSKKLIYAINYRGELPTDFKNPSLLSSIGVDSDEKTKGIGSLLIDSFCNEAFSFGADVVYLTTDRNDNEYVNSFYVKNGFLLEGTVEKTNGRTMNRYIRIPDEKTV